MGKHPKMDKSTIYFIVICVIVLLFIFSPLLIRVHFIYEIIQNYLDVFKNIEYKSAYVETVGAILGTFLAITGAIWTQNILNKYEKKRQIEKNALIVYYDFKFALDNVLEIMEVICPLTKSNTLPEDEAILDKFYKLRHVRNIYIDANWRQLVTSLRDELTVDEIREAQILYSKLAMICASFGDSDFEMKRKVGRKIYSIMFSMINLEYSLKQPVVCEILINNNISRLIEKISKIAHIEGK